MQLVKTEDAVGMVLCHDITQIIKGVTKDAVFRKGHIIQPEDIPVLLSVGKDNIYVWENDDSMLHEDEAAEILRDMCMNEGMSASKPKEGKIELTAERDGLFLVDRERLRAVNSFGRMMIATRPGGVAVKAGDKLCGTRIIPLVIEKEAMAQAKAVAGEACVPFFSISGSDFVEMFVGVGASRVRDMFEQARKVAPCLIFIDEIDAVGRSRFSGIGGGHDEREQTLNALLVEMDGLETQEGVILLAATNRVDVLDPALLRPGRFDRQIVIDLPDIRGRRKILDVHAKTVKLEPTVDLDLIAKSTPGFSGADLANLINEAALLAARYDRKAATQQDLEEARDKVCWGRERRSRKIPERERRLTAWHEAGHAIASLYCKYATPLHKVTIIPRGMALGMTMMLPEEDRYSRTRLEMLDDMVIDMGGRVAEEITFGDITGGASADISHATNVAHAMVCRFGMSEKLGTVQYGERSDHIYLGRDITRSESFSEETAREIDLEVKRLVMESKKRCEQILNEHKDKLDKLAEALLEKETMNVAEIRKLLELPAPQEEVKAEDDTHNEIVPEQNADTQAQV